MLSATIAAVVSVASTNYDPQGFSKSNISFEGNDGFSDIADEEVHWIVFAVDTTFAEGQVPIPPSPHLPLHRKYLLYSDEDVAAHYANASNFFLDLIGVDFGDEPVLFPFMVFSSSFFFLPTLAHIYKVDPETGIVTTRDGSFSMLPLVGGHGSPRAIFTSFAGDMYDNPFDIPSEVL